MVFVNSVRLNLITYMEMIKMVSSIWYLKHFRSMKKITFIYCIVLSLLLLGSCRDYVEIEPESNERELKYTSDFRALVNSYSNFEYAWSYPIISSDDTEFDDSYQYTVSDIIGRIYTWDDYFFVEDNQDSDWSNLYKAIYYCNVIIDGVMDSEKGTSSEKIEIMAEAKVHRAFAYLCLVNMYAPHYSSSAKDEKSVPLLLTPDLFASLSRATVQEVYDQIIEDLTTAIDPLPEQPEFNVLASKISAYAVLARTYLYMGNYQLALENAQYALDIQSSLIDFNDIASNPYSYPVKLENPEIILSKKALYSYINKPLSNDLISLLDDNDLRKSVYTISGSSVYPTFDGYTFGIYTYSYSNGVNMGPSVPEMYLIKAECQARLDAVGTDAVATINELRKKRFLSGSDYEIVVGNGESALDYVLRERRIELMGRGFRWVDMKRLYLEDPSSAPVSRTYRGETITFDSETDFVYPIFSDYIDLNPELGE